MGDHQLLKLVRMRYKVLIRVMVSFVMLLALLNLGESLNTYHEQQKNTMTATEFIASKKEQPNIMIQVLKMKVMQLILRNSVI